ncbi:MAG: two-component system LytT family response regulator [Saprospiraceae bacterium]|jgi:two-component system LytT family response regulator
MTTFNFPTTELPFASNFTKHPLYMVRVVIIENEVDAQSLLSSIIQEYCPSLELVGMAKNINDGLSLIENTRPDLVFIDIEIDGGTSFQLLDKLVHMSFKIIFTTAYDQHALKAFKYGAVDYLLKPYSPQDVLKSVERVRRTLYDQAIFNRLDFLIKNNKPEHNKKMSIPTSEGVSVISVNDIVKVEADRSYCFICLSDGERMLVSKPLKEIEENLPSKMFFRVHTTHLINMEYIKKYVKEDGGYVIMNDGSSVPIARRRKQHFLEMLGKQCYNSIL